MIISISTDEACYARNYIIEAKRKIAGILAKDHPYLSLDMNPEGKEEDQFVFTVKIYPVPVLNVYSDSPWSILWGTAAYGLKGMINSIDVKF